MDRLNKSGIGRAFVIIAGCALIFMVFLFFFLGMNAIPSLSKTKDIHAEMQGISTAAQLRVIVAQSSDEIIKADYTGISKRISEVFSAKAVFALSIDGQKAAGAGVSGDEISTFESILPKYDGSAVKVKLEVKP
jgi:hypothetical protein